MVSVRRLRMKEMIAIDLTDMPLGIAKIHSLNVGSVGIEISKMHRGDSETIKKEVFKHSKIGVINLDALITEVNFEVENHYLKQLGVGLEIGLELKCANFLVALDLIAVKGEMAKIPSKPQESEILKNSFEILAHLKRVFEGRKKNLYITPLSLLSHMSLFERVAQLANVLEFINSPLIHIGLELGGVSEQEIERILVTYGEKIRYIKLPRKEYEQKNALISRFFQNDNSVILSVDTN